MNKFIIAVFLVAQACTPLMYNLYGIKELKKHDPEKAEIFYRQLDLHNISSEHIFADSVAFFAPTKIVKNKKLKQALSQPVQILYFKDDTLKSVHANCYAKGKISNLDWNVNNRFEEFIPASAIKLDSATLTKSQFPLLVGKHNEKTYTIFLIYSRMYEKISRTAIAEVVSNARRFNQEKNIHMIIVNIDKCVVK